MACEATIFLDFEFATNAGVEARLWDAHSLINSRYRKMHQHYLKADSKNKVVEQRKLEKHYVDFIKTSQFFYKGYIQRLASHFAGMNGLRRIAHRLSLTTLTVDARVQVSLLVEEMIEMSCHATLLHLGDLSRYRNEIRKKDRSWESAIAYYNLAGDLHPESGSSHNQLAVIALADENHLDVLYHLYRAIAVNEPHPAARKNLEVEFKKIITSWEKNTHLPTRKDSEATLVLWFVRLHAKLYKGEDFSTHDELENEVLTRLANLLKEQSFEVTLEKFVLINIAAEYLAAERVKGERFQVLNRCLLTGFVELNSATNVESFYFFLRLNVRMIFVLLQVLLPELDDHATGEDLPNSSDGASDRSREKITVIARRILPVLRQYSTWLLSEARILVVDHPGSIGVYIKELWKMYADVMTALATHFNGTAFPDLTYLLEEDQTTVGFKPLRDPELNGSVDLYTDQKGLLKPRCTDKGVERSHPNDEMQGRVRDVLLCAMHLISRDDCSIVLEQGRFVYVEEGLRLISPVAAQAAQSSASHTTHKISNFGTPDFAIQQQDERLPEESAAASDSQHSMDNDMHRMVDDLLAPSAGHFTASNETSYGMHSNTAHEIFALPGLGHIHQTPNMAAKTLPLLWNTPFTPQPNELQPNSPDRPPTARQLSHLQLSTPQQQIEAATALDRMTGYASFQTPWGKAPSKPQDNQMSPPFNHASQQSVAQQTRPTPTSYSAFTDTSSIYANSAPHHEHRRGGTLGSGPVAGFNGNNTTVYAGASDFDDDTMLQTPLWNANGSQAGGYTHTPPGGQGG